MFDFVMVVDEAAVDATRQDDELLVWLVDASRRHASLLGDGSYENDDLGNLRCDEGSDCDSFLQKRTITSGWKENVADSLRFSFGLVSVEALSFDDCFFNCFPSADFFSPIRKQLLSSEASKS